MGLALAIACAVTLLNGISLRSATVFQPLWWLPLIVGYTLLGSFALFRLHKQQRLRALCAVRSGDISIGVLLGFGLLVAAWVIKTRLIPVESGREGWLVQIQTLMASLAGPVPVVVSQLWLTLMEEIVWRGMLAHEIKAKMGQRKALPLAISLYAASALPTVWTLADPFTGPNPLLLLAALGAGLIWTALSLMSGRLIAVWVSHVVFLFFVGTPLPFLQIFP